jgi:GNAT superfamily N-acetyltransferase
MTEQAETTPIIINSTPTEKMSQIYKVRLLKNIDSGKPSDIILHKEKDAKMLIERGYAEYLNQDFPGRLEQLSTLTERLKEAGLNLDCFLKVGGSFIIDEKTKEEKEYKPKAPFESDWQNKPIAFIAVSFTRMKAKYYRVSRLVVLPDYQGIGVGKHLLDLIAELYTSQTKIPFYILTSNPQIIRANLGNWKICRFGHANTGRRESRINDGLKESLSRKRITVSLQYIQKKQSEISKLIEKKRFAIIL